MENRRGGSGKRPWLAALLGTLATGLGHLYLRRWKRGLGWFAVAVAVSAVVVPPEAARSLLSGSGGDVATLAPVVAIGVASVADAYVLARLRQREADDRADGAAAAPASGSGSASGAGGSATIAAGSAAVEEVSGSDGRECPECGRALDPELDFCTWCTARLDGENESDG